MMSKFIVCAFFTCSLAFLLRFRKRKKRLLTFWLNAHGWAFSFHSRVWVNEIASQSKRVWFSRPIANIKFLSFARLNHVFKPCNVRRALPAYAHNTKPISAMIVVLERNFSPLLLLLLFVNDNEVIKVYLIVKTVQSLTECRHIFSRVNIPLELYWSSS